jgi:hypothetical protein
VWKRAYWLLCLVRGSLPISDAFQVWSSKLDCCCYNSQCICVVHKMQNIIGHNFWLDSPIWKPNINWVHMKLLSNTVLAFPWKNDKWRKNSSFSEKLSLNGLFLLQFSFFQKGASTVLESNIPSTQFIFGFQKGSLVQKLWQSQWEKFVKRI